MDLYPTIAGWCGAEVPTDRTIEGLDPAPPLTGESDDSPHEAFFYYQGGNLEAVRVGRWKLHVAKTGWADEQQPEMLELYDLEADIGETTDVADDHPDVVAELQTHLDRAREQMGDGLRLQAGNDVRPEGKVDNPVSLTVWNPDNPYHMAEYDLADRG